MADIDMPSKKMKTQLYLEQALIILLKSRSCDKISMRALVEKAGISRTSFYMQFQDKDDFLKRFTDSNWMMIHYACTGILPVNLRRFSKHGFLSYYTRIFRYIEDNKGL